MEATNEWPERHDSVDLDELRRAVAALPAQVAAIADECRKRADFATARRLAPRAPRCVAKRKARRLSLVDPLPKPAHQDHDVLVWLARALPLVLPAPWEDRRVPSDDGPSSPPTLVDCLRAPGAPQLTAA